MTPDFTGTCLLHIFLLTYNRETTFRRTLEAIAASPLKDHPLTVMDNCSTDGTPGVCREFSPLLPRMQVLRHARNIGFGANYLRALELSQGEYTWVLCDDDTIFPDRIDALLDLLRTAGPEACFVGGPRQEDWPAGLNLRPLDLQRDCRTFITGPSFVPAVIFKSSLIGSLELIDGYFSIRTNFPQMIIGKKLIDGNIPCAVLKPPVIRREEPAEKGANAIGVIDGWSAYCRTLPPALRQEGFYSFFAAPNMSGMLKDVMRTVIWAKVERSSDPDFHLARIGANMGGSIRMALILCRLASLAPAGVYNFARETYRKIKYGWLRKPLPPTYHVPIAEDDLRR